MCGPGRVFVRFHDGTSGVVDLRQLIDSNSAGVFAKLRDPEVFAQVGVCFGAVTWPGEIDLAPDAMYQALQEKGEWILRGQASHLENDPSQARNGRE